MITIGPLPASAPATPLVANGAPTTASTSSSILGGGLSFGDVVDALNPLQHIPVASAVYRTVTGSNISGASEIAGDTLYGAFTGNAVFSLAASVGDVAVKQISGASISQNIVNAYTALTSPSTSSGAPTALVADSPVVSQLLAQQADAQAASAGSSPLATAGSPTDFFKTLQSTNSAAQYQRVQTLDAANKMLMKMAV